MLRSCLSIALITVQLNIHAQNSLSLTDAINIALEENLGIQLVTLQEQAQNMQYYKANVGMTPNVDLVAGFLFAGNNVNLTFADGRGINRWGRNINPSSSIVADMVIYDGGQMRAAFDRLGLLNDLSSIQRKALIQNTVAQVMRSYYEIERVRETVNFQKIVISYYEERLKITQQRWEIGRGSKIDYLQSKADLNAQISELVRTENNLRNAKVVLNGLLNRDATEEFETIYPENNRAEMILSDLMTVALEHNWELVSLQKTIEIARKEEDLRSRAVLPIVSVGSNLSYNFSDNNAGFFVTNQTIASSVNIGARWNLFDGFNRKKQTDIAKLNVQISQKNYEANKTLILNDLTLMYNQYVNDREILQLEEENKAIAVENLEISIEKFKLGGSTILELIEAQRTYDTALNRFVNAKFNANLSELELLRITGLIAY